MISSFIYIKFTSSAYTFSFDILILYRLEYASLYRSNPVLYELIAQLLVKLGHLSFLCQNTNLHYSLERGAAAIRAQKWGKNLHSTLSFGVNQPTSTSDSGDSSPGGSNRLCWLVVDHHTKFLCYEQNYVFEKASSRTVNSVT